MMKESFLRYLEHEKRFSPHTLTAYRTDLEQFLQFLDHTFDIQSPTEVTHTQVRSWTVELLNEGKSTSSINRKLSTLKTFYRFLQRRHGLERNPMLKVLSPKTGKRLPHVVRADELDTLFEQVKFPDDFVGLRDRVLLELLYNTGMRRSELINLKIEDLDFSQNVLKVLGKGNKERLIPFGQGLAKLVLGYIEMRQQTFGESAFPHLLLTKHGKPLYPKAAYNIVRKYLTAVSTVEKKSPHVLRHSFATHLSDNGADLNAIKALLGHANLAATQIYTHNSIEKLKKVYESAHPKAQLDKDN
ncbi:MAG: tyrosine-type recombinase/integrase [Cyanothece sp. SIO1E1]|nr:tyrosine-type recombinase/integrase [Cyanothece sp. SIO1E1]